MDISCANVLLTAPAPHVSQPRSARTPPAHHRAPHGALALTSVPAALAATQGRAARPRRREPRDGDRIARTRPSTCLTTGSSRRTPRTTMIRATGGMSGSTKGHELRFSDAGRYERPTSNSINAWTGTSGKPYFGIVQPTLGPDGYPVLKAGNIYQFKGGSQQRNSPSRISSTTRPCPQARLP